MSTPKRLSGSNEPRITEDIRQLLIAAHAEGEVSGREKEREAITEWLEISMVEGLIRLADEIRAGAHITAKLADDFDAAKAEGKE